MYLLKQVLQPRKLLAKVAPFINQHPPTLLQLVQRVAEKRFPSQPNFILHAVKLVRETKKLILVWLLQQFLREGNLPRPHVHDTSQ